MRNRTLANSQSYFSILLGYCLIIVYYKDSLILRRLIKRFHLFSYTVSYCYVYAYLRLIQCGIIKELRVQLKPGNPDPLYYQMG